MVCSARLNWRSPPRLSGCRCVCPLEAGTGATPASRAKQASERALVRSDLALPEEGAYPAVTSVVICTASREITLDDETAAALLERIWRDGGHDHERAENPLLAAINRGGGRVEWSDEAKAAA